MTAYPQSPRVPIPPLPSLDRYPSKQMHSPCDVERKHEMFGELQRLSDVPTEPANQRSDLGWIETTKVSDLTRHAQIDLSAVV